MKKRHIVLSLTALLCLSQAAFSQDFQTGYFLGGYKYAFRMNPAIQNERGMFAIALGNIGLGVQSKNLGVGTFLYPMDGAVVTAFNDNVPSSTFLGKLSRNGNGLGGNMGMDLLTLGFWKGLDYYTFDLRARADLRTNLPYGLFEFLKDGTTSNDSFDLSGTSLGFDGIVEAAAGWSRRFDDRFTVGGRVKLLFGAASVRMMMNKLNVTFSEDVWSFNGQGTLEASSPSLTVNTDNNGYFSVDDIDLGNLDSPMDLLDPAGFGAAVDLGATWDIFPWLTASASFLDIGGLKWNREIYGVTPDNGYTWDPANREPIDLMDENSSSLDGELSRLSDELENMLAFKKQNSPGGTFSMLPFRAYLGIEGRLPSYPRLTMGLLGSLTSQRYFKWSEARMSINWNPLDWLSFSGSSGLGTLGESFGFAVNIHPRVFNLFIGSDFIPFKIIPSSKLVPADELDDIPLPASVMKHIGLPTGHLNANLYVGLSLAIGKRHLTHTRSLYHAPQEEESVLEAPMEAPAEEIAVEEGSAEQETVEKQAEAE